MKALKSKNRLSKSPKKRNLNDLFEKGKGFIESINPSENVLLIHHTDVDGYCSGAIFLAGLKRIDKNIKIEITAAANEEIENLVKSEDVKSYNKIIILDVDVSYLKKEFENFEGQTLIIDHHSLRVDLNADKIVYINPRFENEEIYQPTSYIVYKFLSSIVDLKDLEWLAVLGTIGDYAFEDCKDLLEKWVHVEKKKDVIKTDFWKVSKMVYGTIIIEARNVIEILIESENLSKLKSNPKVISAYSKFEKAYNGVEKEFWNKAEKIDNIIISVITPTLKRMGSALLNDISFENEDKFIILLERRGENFKVHSRYQSGKIHLGKLMEKCCTLGGGGHRHAAGGSIRTSDFEKFKNCIISNVSNLT